MRTLPALLGQARNSNCLLPLIIPTVSNVHFTVPLPLWSGLKHAIQHIYAHRLLKLLNSILLRRLIFKKLFITCVPMCGHGHTCMPWCICRSQRTIYSSQFSLPCESPGSVYLLVVIKNSLVMVARWHRELRCLLPSLMT